MPFGPHALVAFGGRLNTNSVPNEIWQCGIRVTGSGDGFVADPDLYLSEAAIAIADVLAGSDLMPATTKVDYVKCNNIAPDGKYADPTSHTYDTTVAVQPTAQPKMPDILSLVISWGTGIQRGPAAKGRIYLPNYAAGPISIDRMRVQTATAQDAVGLGQALLDAVANTAGTVSVTPVVASAINGTIRPIISIRVGDVVDVQRRRKNAMVETYSSGPWPAS